MPSLIQEVVGVIAKANHFITYLVLGIYLNLRLEKHHWGDRKIPIRNIIVMINEKPKEEFKHVKVVTLNELTGYIQYFDQVFDDDEVGEIVEFDVASQDLTYGFGVFREDQTMLFQMQVVPGHRNDILWKFLTPGLYTIRSTEYSGPKGVAMIIENAIEVVESK